MSTQSISPRRLTTRRPNRRGPLAWLRGRFGGYRRQAERLALEKQRLEAFLGSLPDPYCGWNQLGVQAISPRFLELLGVDKIDVIDDVGDALDPSDAAALHGLFTRLRETGQPFDLTARRADGVRLFKFRAISGVDFSGQEKFDVLWLTDVTNETSTRNESEQRRADAETLRDEVRAVIDAIPMPVWLYRADGSLAFCNSAYAEAVDSTVAMAVADQRKLFTPVGSGVHANGDAHRQHVVIQGRRRLMQVVEHALGVSDMTLGYAIDETVAETALGDLDRHVRAHGQVLEQLGTAIAIFRADERLSFHNNALVGLFDFDEQWLSRSPAPMMVEVLDDLRSRRMLPEVADFRGYKKAFIDRFTSLIDPHDEMMHLPDGRAIHMSVTPHPFGGLLYSFEDVTSRLQLETSYNTLIAVQRETIDNLAEGLVVFGGDGRAKLWNPAFLKMWRLEDKDLTGEPHIEAILERCKPLFEYGQDWETYRDELIVQSLDRVSRNGRMMRTDSSVLDYAVVPLPDGGVLTSYVDVTDSARVESALREKNVALENADRLKTEFLANVSYQLRTPLNAIIGFAEILTHEYFGKLSSKQMEYASGVHDAGNRLMKLVDDILDMATIEAGYFTLNVATVNIHALLESVADVAQDWLRKENLRFHFDCPPTIGSAELDEQRIKQALINLISNAVAFTPSGGTVTLAVRRDRETVSLTVADTGVGIPKSEQKRVFGRFERANPQVQSTGAGLGLPLVKSIIELHGGSIEMESVPGEGTTVTCILPLRRPTDENQLELPTTPPVAPPVD